MIGDVVGHPEIQAHRHGSAGQISRPRGGSLLKQKTRRSDCPPTPPMSKTVMRQALNDARLHPAEEASPARSSDCTTAVLDRTRRLSGRSSPAQPTTNADTIKDGKNLRQPGQFLSILEP